MKLFSLSALILLIAASPLANAATSVTSTTTRTATMTRAQMHTTNNIRRYSNRTINNLSRYGRTECARHHGVMIKQKSNGRLVCVAKMN